MKNLPQPTITRLCQIYRICRDLAAQGTHRTSSTELGRLLAVPAHTIRKDLNHLGEVGHTGAGYDPARLRDQIARTLHLHRRRRLCIVGLGRLGSALLDYHLEHDEEFEVVAGFDRNINRIETLRSDVPLYPTYEIPETVNRLGIELAMLAIPAAAAQEVTDQLVTAGIQAIVSFAPTVVTASRPGVVVRHVDLVHELRMVSSLLALQAEAGPTP